MLTVSRCLQPDLWTCEFSRSPFPPIHHLSPPDSRVSPLSVAAVRLSTLACSSALTAATDPFRRHPALSSSAEDYREEGDCEEEKVNRQNSYWVAGVALRIRRVLASSKESLVSYSSTAFPPLSTTSPLALVSTTSLIRSFTSRLAADAVRLLGPDTYQYRVFPLLAPSWALPTMPIPSSVPPCRPIVAVARFRLPDGHHSAVQTPTFRHVPLSLHPRLDGQHSTEHPRREHYASTHSEHCANERSDSSMRRSRTRRRRKYRCVYLPSRAFPRTTNDTVTFSSAPPLPFDHPTNRTRRRRRSPTEAAAVSRLSGLDSTPSTFVSTTLSPLASSTSTATASPMPRCGQRSTRRQNPASSLVFDGEEIKRMTYRSE
ncbi:hypothetical protein R3P38DRAFT_3207638 [Favolaschia claudopus]|uniref:Uncharacterized protein n=1 Tax=Favolaschia claudopus TaxID=2862362 RepID=A0AAW0AIR3_9AGAR